ncbi:hypothetical protein SCHPADRAFT_945081 [Schizopora paradoxa]|uniref:Zn(2)-C6 fungal-type domain-containing protein n=1 Tax=Schizopora paradoxa TaxID=27342 RepID=A0A0H2RS56_9AGAM|nr:hypothetical protein SCHPADRAFT_945081 [Schizopora paradoxa]
MCSNVLEIASSSSEDAKDIPKKSTKLNMKPCQSCKEARKKCDLFEGAYPCKRCLDRFFKGVTSTIVCGPSQRRSRSRKNDLGNGLLTAMDAFPYSTAQWILYNDTQGNLANDFVTTSAIIQGQNHEGFTGATTGNSQQFALSGDIESATGTAEVGQESSANSSWFETPKLLTDL